MARKETAQGVDRLHGMIKTMPDAEIPDDLIELKRRFNTLVAEQAALAATLPPPMAIVTGQAETTEEQRAAWQRIQSELTDLAVRIHAHPFLSALAMPERYQADRAASQAARAAV